MNYDFPLEECKDCSNNKGCSLIKLIEEATDYIPFLDITQSSCDSYTVKHTVDDKWILHIGNTPMIDEEEEDDEYREVTMEDMYDSLEGALEGLTEKGHTKFNIVAMSWETSQLFLPEDRKGKELTHIVSEKYGTLEVFIDNTIELYFFAIAI